MADQDWKSTLISKAPDIFHILLTILGILIVILGIAGGVEYHGWFPVTSSYGRLMLGVLGVVVVGLGLYLRKASANVDGPSPKEYGAKISHPKSGDKVQKVDVRGVIKKTPPPRFKLWVFRVYSDGSIWPLRECRLNQDGDEWEARDCDIGGQQGERRDLSVNLVGPDGGALIKYLYAAMERHKQVRDELERVTNKTNIHYSPLITERTQDMVECDRVPVERA